MSSLHAHLLCAALVVLDSLARALRIQFFALGLGSRIRFFHAIVLNLFGDAAASVSPLRVAGQPARLLGLHHAGMSTKSAIVTIAIEALATYAVVIVTGLFLAWRYGADWLADAGPLLASVWRILPWVTLALLVGILVYRLRTRRSALASEPSSEGWAATFAAARHIPLWIWVASVPLSVMNILGRVLILPILAQTLPEAPSFGATTLGSFALLYGQIFLPTPSGAGAVDTGFLRGAAGDLGDAGKRLLFWWRIYTTMLALVAGFTGAALVYGSAAVRKVFARRPRAGT